MVDSLRDLSDAPASVTETELLKQTCLGVSGVIAVEEIKARKSGPYLYVEATVHVDGNISASAAHRCVCACMSIFLIMCIFYFEQLIHHPLHRTCFSLELRN